MSFVKKAPTKQCPECNVNEIRRAEESETEKQFISLEKEIGLRGKESSSKDRRKHSKKELSTERKGVGVNKHCETDVRLPVDGGNDVMGIQEDVVNRLNQIISETGVEGTEEEEVVNDLNSSHDTLERVAETKIILESEKLDKCFDLPIVERIVKAPINNEVR
ncbi:AT-rich interactive domain-containing protein 4B-like [Schistocerca cancellata]|uniref:AT-rich interactive domain-containing protein 4B-like n=1 Tax=Schistocerca cancellata TaxID=274614 RepID=UPI0021188533|nr:AT-rich interactive domain-containing protein 4B-like [Schistocerca cancellata]